MAELQPLEDAFPLFWIRADETPCHFLDLCLRVWGAAEVRRIAAGQSIVRVDGDQEPREFRFATPG